MKIITKEELKKIEEFSKKVAVLYEFFRWDWSRLDGPPNEEELKKHIIYLIESMRKDGEIYSSSSGGITVEDHGCGTDIYFSKEFHCFI